MTGETPMQHDQARFFDTQDPYLNEKKDQRIKRINEFLAASWGRLNAPGQPAPTAVLDIGCANGSALSQLPDGLYKAGLDVSTALLELAKAKGIDTYCVDVDRDPLPFESGRFDMVIATDVIEHVLHTDHLLNEMNRVLRPGGVLVAGLPNINQPISLIMQFLLDLTPMFASRYRCPHYRDFTSRLFRLILKKHGFSITQCEGSYIFPFENSRAGIWVAKRVPRWGTQILFDAKKEKDRTVEDGFHPDMPSLLKWLEE
jgi:SAM-dependent methyltransferase